MQIAKIHTKRRLCCVILRDVTRPGRQAPNLRLPLVAHPRNTESILPVTGRQTVQEVSMVQSNREFARPREVANTRRRPRRQQVGGIDHPERIAHHERITALGICLMTERIPDLNKAYTR
jgi:hypothetical protein